MQRMLAVAAITVTLSVPGLVSAAEVDHYEGKPSKNLDEALVNLAEYNRKLEEILGQEEISPGDMERIHQLTYTLEKALARINTEVADLAATLEQLHLSSESRERDAVREHGAGYLEGARKLTK